jgi:uncharacterized OB-fold protein
MGMKGVHLDDIVDVYKPGDPKPGAYVARSEWADGQLRAGLRQRRCRTCGLWRFPQEPCCAAIEPANQRDGD